MVVKLSVTAAIDPRDTKLSEESLYLDSSSLFRNRSWQLDLAADRMYSEVDTQTITRQRDIAFVQNEEVFERPMTEAELAEKAKASSRGIRLNPNSTQFQNVQAQSAQQNIARIESAQPLNQGMVVVSAERNGLGLSRESSPAKFEVSRSRSGSTVTPAVAERAESRFRDAVRERRSSSRRRSQRADNSSNPLVVGTFTAAFFDSRSYRESTVEGFITELVKSREPNGTIADRIREISSRANSNELVLAN